MDVLLFASALAVAAGAAVFFLLHPYVLDRAKSLTAAGAAAVVVGVLLAVPWPARPLARVLYEKGRAEFRVGRVIEEMRVERSKQEYARKTIRRFGGVAEFLAAPGAPQGGWAYGAAGGRKAWLDEESGLVWGEALAVELPDYSDASWRAAKDACAAAEPPGVWALPSMTEFLRAKKRGMAAVVGDFRVRPKWYATVFVPDTHLEIMALFGSAPSSNAGSHASRVGVRCVARTPKAPEEGYPVGTNEDALSALTGG